MILANKGILPPEEWYHNSELQNKKGKTVAMFLAKRKLDVPDEWYHDPEL